MEHIHELKCGCAKNTKLVTVKPIEDFKEIDFGKCIQCNKEKILIIPKDGK